MGQALRGDVGHRRIGWGALARGLATIAVAAVVLVLTARVVPAQVQAAPERIDRGRFTAVFYPSERTLATSLLDGALLADSFPGLPRPRQRVLLEIAPDRQRFREWVGPNAPEWGAAIAFPESQRIIMQGRSAGTDAGDPREVLRHELAHLALYEDLGDLPPRWFDEGYASYAAHEWKREDALAASIALALRGAPTFDELDAQFNAGTLTAQNAYALAYRAIVELAALDTAAGLTRFFEDWKMSGKIDRAMRASFGLTFADFEQRFRQRTRRRYGALALASDVTLLGLLTVVLVFPLYVLRRQRDRRRLAALVASDEAAERAARESIIEALLRGDDTPDFGSESRPTPPS